MKRVDRNAETWVALRHYGAGDMVTTMSSNEAKQHWGSLLGSVSEHGDEVIVESHGKPKVAVVSISAYKELQTLREQRRRSDALERLSRLEGRIAESNAGSTETEEETIAFAIKLGREINRAVAAREAGSIERDCR